MTQVVHPCTTDQRMHPCTTDHVVHPCTDRSRWLQGAHGQLEEVQGVRGSGWPPHDMKVWKVWRVCVKCVGYGRFTPDMKVASCAIISQSRASGARG